jgi:hypothetical protein
LAAGPHGAVLRTRNGLSRCDGFGSSPSRTEWRSI